MPVAPQRGQGKRLVIRTSTQASYARFKLSRGAGGVSRASATATTAARCISGSLCETPACVSAEGGTCSGNHIVCEYAPVWLRPFGPGVVWLRKECKLLPNYVWYNHEKHRVNGDDCVGSCLFMPMSDAFVIFHVKCKVFQPPARRGRKPAGPKQTSGSNVKYIKEEALVYYRSRIVCLADADVNAQ